MCRVTCTLFSRRCIIAWTAAFSAFLLTCMLRCMCCMADSEAGQSLNDYDYREIDQAVEQMNESSYSISFAQVVQTIIAGGDGVEMKGLSQSFLHIFTQTFQSSRTAVMQIIMLAVLSAGIHCFAPAFNKSQVSDTAQMVIQLSLITVLLAAFYVACGICTDAVSGCVDIYKALVPVFMSVVSFASGSVTAGAYYELILLMITAVSGIFGRLLVTLSKVYVLIVMADSVTGEERFTKAGELIPKIIKWTCKTALVLFTGLGGIKGMINPMTDSMKKSALYKSMQMIPGIGGSVETVSQTVFGAGTIVKNGIGTSAIVVLVVVCSIPVLKLTMLTVLFKVTAAAIEPVSDKRLVKAVNGISAAIGTLAVIVLASVSLFVLMSAVICISTNLNYVA